MNYPESQLILEEIKKANKILINCHRGPDSDSVGSALSMKATLNNLGKDVTVICPNDIPEDLTFLHGSDVIKKVDFKEFNFKDYDLFLILDSSEYRMVTGDKNIKMTKDVKIVVIDHHFTNVGYGEINLIDSDVTSTAELLYKIFEDWKIKITSDVATMILTGILGDTGCFQYAGSKSTFEIAGKLLEFGANKNLIILNIYRSVDFKILKFWAKVLEDFKYDDEYNFVWSAIPNSIYKRYGADSSAKDDAVNLFSPVVKKTDFGLIMVESDKNVLSVSFRARSNFDVSKIAQELGGGGHISAAGAKVEGVFNEAVEKVLVACRKYARKN